MTSAIDYQIGDYRGKTPKKTQSGIRLLTAKVIKNGRINEGNEEYISESYYDEWMRRGLPEQWDVLITTEAPLGEVALLRTKEKVALAQRVILLRGKSDKIDQRYLYYALQSSLVQGRLAAKSTGTTVAGIKQSELRKVEIPVFPLKYQYRIASTLSAYDDFIENNTRRIKILKEMAQRIYKEWFVDFRFPGHEKVKFVDSELGRIPSGWEVSLVDTCFSAAELAAKALLLTTPFPGENKKMSHGRIHARYNLEAKMGNVDVSHKDAFNRLKALRSSARYLNETLSLDENEGRELIKAGEEAIAFAAKRTQPYSTYGRAKGRRAPVRRSLYASKDILRRSFKLKAV